MIIFDRDGTLIGSLTDYDANHPKHIKHPSDQKLILPMSKIIQDRGERICIASNQGGVHGTVRYTSLENVAAQMFYLFHLLPVEIALFCTDNAGERCFAVNSRGQCWEIGLDFPDLIGTYRKPGGGMLEIIKRLYVAPSYLYVGDMPTDEQAANAAGMEFEYVKDFIQKY